MKGRIKESRLVYKSEWLEVYEDFISVNKRPEIQQRKKESDNHIKLYNKIKMPQDCATIIPIFPDGSILMIESYRHGVNTVFLELPGGLINNKEQPNEAALKELQEETGYACKTLEAKGWYYVWPSKVNQKNFVFLAKQLEKVSGQRLEDTESAKIHTLSKEEIIRKLRNREIQSAETIAALCYGYISYY
jgi:ADP-ribose pyrophosphatase